jgi:hypothetical protein
VHVRTSINVKMLWHNPRMSVRVSRETALTAAALTAIVVYCALLRLDAITQMYGPVRSPHWMQQLQQSRMGESVLRPRAMSWPPVPEYPHADGPPTRYRSDPYTYLKYAREMRSFYAAHVREPLFPFVTKVFLWIFDGQDVAVSFASASFSLLSIVATYLVGATAFSRVTGLVAALALGVEHELIGWNVGGWRDDAFTAMVMVFAYALLRFWRTPSRPNALIVGIAAGAACLVRITSLSFIAAGFAALLLVRRSAWSARAIQLSLSGATAAAIVAPYIVNCWLTFGDPLYAINFHTGAYRATEGQSADVKQTAGEYLGQHFRASPLRTIDTFMLGMTSYPFTNKWRGYRPWGDPVGRWLSRAAVVGLLFFLASASGRLLLVLLAGSMLPYAFTWRVASDWRFTEHTYPFYLLAAAYAVQQLLMLLAPSRLREPLARYRRPKAAIAATAVALGVFGGFWTITRVMPPLIAKETLRSGENVSITAGDRDAAFFVDGWSSAVREGNVTTRAARSSHSTVNVPLPDARDYEMTARLDPHPRPAEGSTPQLPTMVVFVNNERLASFQMTWDPQRVGAYDFRAPAALVRPGMNRITFMSESGGHFKLWYLRIRPQ